MIVPLSTLIEATDNPGLIPGWGPVLPDIARQVAFDQQANPVWKWSVTDGSGQLMRHGHTGRRPNAAETAFVQARDRTCRAPGCNRRAIRCDIDHRQQHSDDGPSHRGNNCCPCVRHHQMKHRLGFTIHHIGLAGFMWEAPDGRLCLVPPDGNIVAVEEALDDDDKNAGRRLGSRRRSWTPAGPADHPRVTRTPG